MIERSTFDLGQANLDIARSINRSPHCEELLGVLCGEIGPRPMGSPQMRRALNVLSRQWQGLGASGVSVEEVPVLAWRPGASTVEMLKPAHHAYDNVQCVYTGSTAVEGPLVVTPPVNSDELSRLGRQFRGATVLVKGHQISGGKYELLNKRVIAIQDAGAAAVLLISRHPELPTIECMFPTRPVTIPVLGLSGRDGAQLAEHCRVNDPVIRLNTEGQPYDATCANLIGQIGPDGDDVDVIVLSAHFDSFHLAPGAFDNLTGVVTMTEIARTLSAYQTHFRRQLRLIAFTGEEYGFVGSKHYVRRHADQLDRIRFDLNLDSLFDSTAEGIAVMWSPSMRDYIARALEQLHPEVDVRNQFCFSSDYLSFMLQGIPAARPADWKGSFPVWGHTIQDTHDKIPPVWLKSNAVVLARLLLKMLTDDNDLPSRRRDRQEVQALLKQECVEKFLDYLNV